MDECAKKLGWISKIKEMGFQVTAKCNNVFKGAPLPIIGRAVIGNKASAVRNSAALATVANQFCFETGCFVYNLNVL